MLKCCAGTGRNSEFPWKRSSKTTGSTVALAVPSFLQEAAARLRNGNLLINKQLKRIRNKKFEVFSLSLNYPAVQSLECFEGLGFSSSFCPSQPLVVPHRDGHCPSLSLCHCRTNVGTAVTEGELNCPFTLQRSVLFSQKIFLFSALSLSHNDFVNHSLCNLPFRNLGSRTVIST